MKKENQIIQITSKKMVKEDQIISRNKDINRKEFHIRKTNRG